MKQALLKALADWKGRLVSALGGIIVAVVVRGLAVWGFSLNPGDLNDLTAFVAIIVGWAIDAAFIKLQTDGIKQIQDALPPSVKSDGVPGEKTIAAVEKAVANN